MVGIVQGHDYSIKTTNYRNVLTPSKVSNSRSIRFTVVSRSFSSIVSAQTCSPLFIHLQSLFLSWPSFYPGWFWIVRLIKCVNFWQKHDLTMGDSIAHFKITLVDFSPSTPPASKYGLGRSRPTEKSEVRGFAVGLENFGVGLEILRWTWPKSNWTWEF